MRASSNASLPTSVNLKPPLLLGFFHQLNRHTSNCEAVYSGLIILSIASVIRRLSVTKLAISVWIDFGALRQEYYTELISVELLIEFTA
jgi:hypothetical protein